MTRRKYWSVGGGVSGTLPENLQYKWEKERTYMVTLGSVPVHACMDTMTQGHLGSTGDALRGHETISND